MSPASYRAAPPRDGERKVTHSRTNQPNRQRENVPTALSRLVRIARQDLAPQYLALQDLAVVQSALRDANRVVNDLVHQAMFSGDAPGPVTVKSVFERFGFSDALVAVARNVDDQHVDPPEHLPVLALPVEIVLPCRLVPHQLHSSKSRATPPPASSRSIDASSRRALAGFCSRWAVSFKDS